LNCQPGMPLSANVELFYILQRNLAVCQRPAYSLMQCTDDE
jgi:hypothetical protein